MAKKKFKTMYKDLSSIEKRLDELAIRESSYGFTKKEHREFKELVILRQSIGRGKRKKSITEIRSEKITKIINRGV